MADTLTYNSPADATEDMTRQGLTRTISLGLVGFAARTPLGQRLSVRRPPPGAGPGGPPPEAPPQLEEDPWNFWTFTLSLNGYGNGESSSNYYNLNGSVTANRTTEAWKINTRLNGSQRQNTYEYDIDSVHYKTVSTYKNYGLSTLVVKSLGAHLSAGVNGSVTSNTYGNTSLGFSLAPAVEYNFMPYSESSRRQLTVRYSAGVRYADYREVTIYGEDQETRPIHSLQIDYGTTQPGAASSVIGPVTVPARHEEVQHWHWRQHRAQVVQGLLVQHRRQLLAGPRPALPPRPQPDRGGDPARAAAAGHQLRVLRLRPASASLRLHP